MHIKILGTSGSGGWPSLFCNGYASQRALEVGGKNIRSRSSLLIDQVLKIDFPPDSFHQAVSFGFNFSTLKYLLITRSSYNNFAAGEFENLTPFLAQRKNLDFVRIFGNTESIAQLKCMKEIIHATLHEIQPDQMINIGSFDIYPLKAMNNGDLYPLNYIIRKHHKSILYAIDTGVYEEKTWKNLKGLQVQTAIVECSQGPRKSASLEKMGLPDVLTFKKKAEDIGLTNQHTRWIITHFSHLHGLLHEEMEEVARPFGLEVAYDGMELEV